MKQYKHKTLGWIANQNIIDWRYYKVENSSVYTNVHKQLVENSCDWEEIKEEYPIGTKVKDKYKTSIEPIYIKTEARWEWYDQKLPHYLVEGQVGKGKRFELVEEKPEYTILSISCGTSLAKRTLQTYETGKQEYTYVWENSCPYERGYYADFMLNSSKSNKIHSVRRESDGEIFTVDDETKEGRINNFYLVNSILFIRLDTGIDGNWGTYSLSFLHKKAKEKLLTTEDGVDIYEGQHYYCVNSNDFCKPYHTDVYHSSEVKDDMPHNYTWIKKFSTKERAEEYILHNKKLFSLTALENNFHFMGSEKTKLLEMAKTLNKYK